MNIYNNQSEIKNVGNLKKINRRLVSGINIKGGIDSLFSIEDPGSNTQFSSISLCHRNWLRVLT